MDTNHIALVGAVLSSVLLLFTGHPVYLLSGVACSMIVGWQLGKRVIPAEEYGG